MDTRPRNAIDAFGSLPCPNRAYANPSLSGAMRAILGQSHARPLSLRASTWPEGVSARRGTAGSGLLWPMFP